MGFGEFAFPLSPPESFGVSGQARRDPASGEEAGGQLGGVGTHRGMELRDGPRRRRSFRGPVGDVLSGARLADEDTGTEHLAFGFHLVDTTVDQPLLHLEIGYAVAQKAADPVVFFE